MAELITGDLFPKSDTKPEKKPEDSLGEEIIEIVFYITLLISGVSTFKGLYEISNNLYMAITIALLITFLLYIVKIELVKIVRQGFKQKMGEKFKNFELKLVTVPFLIVIIFGLSFTSNLNGFYTFFIEDDIVKDTHIKANNTFNKNCILIKTALKTTTAHEDIITEQIEKEKFTQALVGLEKQITNKSDHGFGTKSKKYLQSIKEKYLNNRLDHFDKLPKSSSLEAAVEFAKMLNNMLLTEYKSQNPLAISIDTTPLLKTIEELQKKHTNIIDHNNFSANKIEEIIRDLNIILAESQNFEFDKELDPIVNGLDRVGGVDYLIESFTQDNLNTGSFYSAIGLAIGIDILGPLLIISFFRKEEEE